MERETDEETSRESLLFVSPSISTRHKRGWRGRICSDGWSQSHLQDRREASQTAFLQDASDIGCTSTRRGIFEKDIIITEEKGIKEKKHHSIWNEKDGGVDGDEVLVIRVLLFLI